jgi:thioredoxin 1
MSEPIHVTDAEFQAKVLQSPLPVIVDFWATWCSPCRAIAPVLERLSVEYDGKLVVAKVDVDENPAYAQQFGVQGIPTLLMISQGKEVSRVVGALPEAKLKDAVMDFLSKAQTQAGGLAAGKAS